MTLIWEFWSWVLLAERPAYAFWALAALGVLYAPTGLNFVQAQSSKIDMHVQRMQELIANDLTLTTHLSRSTMFSRGSRRRTIPHYWVKGDLWETAHPCEKW
jgi:hypothetical protein